MKLIRGLYNIKNTHSSCVATIGNFDGIHKGHRAVLQQLVKEAENFQLSSLLITFEPLPLEFFRKDLAPSRLFTFAEKLRILQQENIDEVMVLKFNAEFAKLSAEEFVAEILVKKLKIKCLVVGDDFRFGYQRQGDHALLKKLGETYEFIVKSTPTLNYLAERVGSSRVRKALAESDFVKAQELLGFPYYMSGRVIHGNKDGRKFGFPTANIALHRQVLPIHGVFIVLVKGLGPQPLPGIANVGRRPTVDGNGRLLEVYLLNFKQDFYGQFIQVEFIEKLREEQKFASIEALKMQIAADVAKAKVFFKLN